MSCTALETPPTKFYAPIELFTPQDLQQLSAEWLGDTITSPAGSFRYRVTSGPLCRLYWGQGKAEPDTIESAYIQDERGRWRRSHSNYLSYQVEGGGFVTVRWEKPMQKTTDCSGIKSEVAADLKLNSIESRLLESFQSNFCTINLSGET